MDPIRQLLRLIVDFLQYCYQSVSKYFIVDAEALKDRDLSVLKEFDLDSEFGPCIGTLA